MNWIRGWMALVVLALFFVVCAEQARGEALAEPDAIEQVDLWTAIAPKIAPRRVQVLNDMIVKHLARNGFDAPDTPVWGGTQIDTWAERLPESTVAYADPRGTVMNPDWVDFADSAWPPMIDTVRILIHENLHQLQAVPDSAYGYWDARQRAIEEGRVEAAAILLGDTFMRRHWPRARYVAMGEAYAACVRVIRVTATRATSSKLKTRSARSYLLWMMRADSTHTICIRRTHPCSPSARLLPAAARAQVAPPRPECQ